MEARKSLNFFAAAKKRSISAPHGRGVESCQAGWPWAMESAQSNKSPMCARICGGMRVLVAMWKLAKGPGEPRRALATRYATVASEWRRSSRAGSDVEAMGDSLLLQRVMKKSLSAERRSAQRKERKSRAVENLKAKNSGVRCRLLLVVDAKVIDEHLLRENGGGVGRAGPIASNGDVEEDEERMIEGPGAAGGPLGLCEGGVEIRIDVEADCARFPLDGIEMKVGGEILACGQAEGRGRIARLGNGAGTVKRTVHGARLPADVFHDVDFA